MNDQDPSNGILEENIEERNEKIQSNLYLVRRIVSQYNFVEKNLHQDLYQEGNIGLIKAVEKYKESFNVKFSTYASFRIKYNIQDYLRKNSSILCIPHNKHCDAFKLKRFIEKRIKQTGSPPLESEMRGFLFCDENRLKEIISIISIINISEDVYFDFDIETFYLKIPYEDSLIKKEIMDILKNFNNKDKKIIMDKYYENKSFREIARENDVSHETIRRSHDRIIESIRKEMVKQRY